MTIRAVVTGGYGNGTFNGTIAEVVLRGYTIGAQAAPVFTGPIPDITATEGDPNVVTDLGAFFTSATTFAIAPAIEPGWSFDVNTAVLTIDTDLGTFGPFTVTATNAGGDTDSNAFSVIVSLAATKLADPSITTPKKRKRSLAPAPQPTPVKPPTFDPKKWNQLMETYDAFLRRQASMVAEAVEEQPTVEAAVEQVIESPKLHEEKTDYFNVLAGELEPLDSVEEPASPAIMASIDESIDNDLRAMVQRIRDEQDLLAIANLALMALNTRH